MKTPGEHSFFKNFLTIGIGSFLYLLIGLIGTPIITRLVDPTDYGQMSILSVYSNMGLMFCGLGLDQTLVRYFYRKEDPEYQNQLLYKCLYLPVALALGTGILMLIAYPLGFQPFTFAELILLLFNVLALILHRYALLIMRLRYHSKLFSLVNIIQKASYIAFTVILIFLVQNHHFVILAVSTILSTLLAAIVGIILERNLWRIPKRSTPFPYHQAELLKYSIPIMLSSSISVIFNALDKLFIQHYCTISDVGVYASAMNLIAVFSIIKTSFNAIWMPSAVEHYEKNPDDNRFFQKGHTFISILMLCFGAAVILCKDLFVLLLGNEYQAASMILPYLMFEPIMYTISETTATGIFVRKKSSYQLIVSSVSCFINFVGNWLLTPVMGPQGAALSTGISYIAFFILRTVLANRVFRVDYKLSRLAVSVTALFAFAVYGSNSHFSCYDLVFYAGVMAVIIFAYRKDFGQAVRYAASTVKKIFKR